MARMATANYNDRLKDYVQVNERIIHFYEQYPTGSIQSEMLTLTETLVVFKAFAFRHPDDPKPGVGHSSLAIPGTTPYTEGSEIENAETSAWGRALAALGFEVKRGIASRNEIENKQKPDNAGVKQAKNISNGTGESRDTGVGSAAQVPAQVGEVGDGRQGREGVGRATDGGTRHHRR